MQATKRTLTQCYSFPFRMLLSKSTNRVTIAYASSTSLYI
uniref:Uncharacterized protein n=1 Tax=Arundo donax TaxID=35708 RepID=A0A0A8ZL73_ARUDO